MPLCTSFTCISHVRAVSCRWIRVRPWRLESIVSEMITDSFEVPEDSPTPPDFAHIKPIKRRRKNPNADHESDDDDADAAAAGMDIDPIPLQSEIGQLDPNDVQSFT